MSKKILIVSTSPRKGSNSEALALAFADGAKEAGNEVDFISLRGKTVNFCRGCFVCQEKLRCVNEPVWPAQSSWAALQKPEKTRSIPPWRKPGIWGETHEEGHPFPASASGASDYRMLRRQPRGH